MRIVVVSNIFLGKSVQNFSTLPRCVGLYCATRTSPGCHGCHGPAQHRIASFFKCKGSNKRSNFVPADPCSWYMRRRQSSCGGFMRIPRCSPLVCCVLEGGGQTGDMLVCDDLRTLAAFQNLCLCLLSAGCLIVDEVHERDLYSGPGLTTDFVVVCVCMCFCVRSCHGSDCQTICPRPLTPALWGKTSQMFL